MYSISLCHKSTDFAWYLKFILICFHRILIFNHTTLLPASTSDTFQKFFSFKVVITGLSQMKQDLVSRWSVHSNTKFFKISIILHVLWAGALFCKYWTPLCSIPCHFSFKSSSSSSFWPPNCSWIVNPTHSLDISNVSSVLLVEIHWLDKIRS